LHAIGEKQKPLEVKGVLDDMCVLRLAGLLAAVQSSYTMPLPSLVPRRDGFEREKEGATAISARASSPNTAKKGRLDALTR
jgi:hypothetical protein